MKLLLHKKIMANTYSQIYIQFVFAVSNRKALIKPEFKNDLLKYMTGIVQNRGQKLIAINSMPDHLHLFAGITPEICMSDLIRDVKSASSKHINEEGWLNQKFNWQRGFGAFSYSRSHIDRVVKYIQNQEQIHKARTFKKEFLEMLNKYDIAYDPKYLFNWFDE